jgi:hypothetical protein
MFNFSWPYLYNCSTSDWGTFDYFDSKWPKNILYNKAETIQYTVRVRVCKHACINFSNLNTTFISVSSNRRKDIFKQKSVP